MVASADQEIRLLAFDRQQDVAVGGVTRDELQGRAGEFLQQERHVVGVRAWTGRAGDQFLLGIPELLEGLVRQVGADGEQRAVHARRADPMELFTSKRTAGNLASCAMPMFGFAARMVSPSGSATL